MVKNRLRRGISVFKMAKIKEKVVALARKISYKIRSARLVKLHRCKLNLFYIFLCRVCIRLVALLYYEENDERVIALSL